MSGDASTSDGWGFFIGPYFTSGLWDEATIAAISRCTAVVKEVDGDQISISPLELWVQALISFALGSEFQSLLAGILQFVARCDNQSSCIVVDTRRASSPAMAAALMIKMEVEKSFGIRGKLEHIPTEENVIADLLSHNRIAEAEMLLRSKWGFARRFEIDAQFLSSSLERVRTAFDVEREHI